MAKNTPATIRCRHEHLHFQNGGLHIVCSNPKCKYVWTAVGACPLRIIQDVMARGMGLSELDTRSDPSAPYPSRS